MDVLVGSPRSLLLDNPAPTVDDVWKLEQVLVGLEDEYDLVIVDTPPSINALTRTAWVASDRVILVTEPALYSVIAADRARKAILEISAKLSPRLELLGVVVNRFRPQSHEHDYRIKELKEIFGDQLLMPYFEERAAVQQATGAARPIHSWPAEGAAEIARGFDWLLAGAISELEQAGVNKSRVGVVDRSMRGSALDEIIEVQEVKEKRKKKRWWSRKSS
jgi:cellulose biosynthesis protein BcsQ